MNSLMRNSLAVFVSALSLLACSSLHAQEDKSSFLSWLIVDDALRSLSMPLHPMPMMVGDFPSKVIDTTLDVQSYQLKFNLVQALLTPKAMRPIRKVEASAGITFRVTLPGIRNIQLNAVTLQIDSVTMNRIRLPHTHADGILDFELPTDAVVGSFYAVVVYYAVTRDDNGLYVFSESDAAKEDAPYASAFTFSQPENARWWFPCNDRPHDKALFSAEVTVPKRFTAVCNGEMTGLVTHADSSQTFSWRHDDLMPTYLFVMHASIYQKYDQEYKRIDGSVVPIANYYWDVDHDSEKYSAVKSLEKIPDMFEKLESRFGPYPFATYGHVAVSPVPFGGMEHQTMTTVNRKWLNGQYLLGYVHEIAHHWIGNLVTCATWADIWLNEGGASLAEALYAESASGVGAYRAVLGSKRNRYMTTGLYEPPVYDIPLGILFNEATTYNKSAWVFHMIRMSAGDDLFFGMLKKFFTKYHLGAAQTAEFRAFVEQEIPNPPVAWQVFFDQWLVKAGHPVFSVTVDIRQPEATRINVRQTQSVSKVPAVFHVPVTIRLPLNGRVLDTTVIMNTAQFELVLDGTDLIGPIEIDPDDKILCKKDITVITDVDESELGQTCLLTTSQVLRLGEPIGLLCGGVGNATISCTDATGRRMHSTTVESGTAHISTHNFASGVVFVNVEQGGSFRSFKILLTNP